MKQTVIGLAGHIDHGKTALVKALTGVNTDSLLEEKQRGMTIDIGFAFLTDQITLIDVPGHEKFIKNMMAGVSNIDVALLVIAADDGIMPQTREHFEILNILNISSALIAINKIDIVDNDWLEMIELDIEEMCKNSFMRNTPIIRVSSETGEGIEEVRDILINICQDVPKKSDRGIFRLHVDRVFSKKGYGTVVTGTVSSGTLQVGDTIEIMPSGITAKARGLQSHSAQVNSVSLGDRAAINLQGIQRKDIQRGAQIMTPGYFQATSSLGVNVKTLHSLSNPIYQNQRIRIHLGTQEVMARIALINNKSIDSNSESAALLRLESPIVAAHKDKFIIRSYSPVMTIGGGEVLDVEMDGKWKDIKKKLESIYNLSDDAQLLQLVENQSNSPMTYTELQIKLGISKKKLDNWIISEKKLFCLEHNRKKWILTYKQWNELTKKIQNFLKKFHMKYPLKGGVQKEEIRQYILSNESFLDATLQTMLDNNQIEQNKKVWLSPSFAISMTSEEKTMHTNIINILDKEGFASSSLDQLVIRTGYNKEKVLRILNVAEEQGALLRINGNMMFTKENFIHLKNKIKDHFALNENLSVPEFKLLANTSRKYAVPLLEYFDKIKITYREGNNRKLVK
tara:strand:- start:1548 stop:3422 length:1875 start_codon:yes stop_codon:yes gene_type:complete